MKFIIEASFPLEPFSTYVRKGIAGERVGEVLASIRPEVAYFTDNGVGLIHTDPSRHVRLATKYAPLVPVFRDLISRPDTPLADAVKRHILSQLDSAEERFEAILEVA